MPEQRSWRKDLAIIASTFIEVISHRPRLTDIPPAAPWWGAARLPMPEATSTPHLYLVTSPSVDEIAGPQVVELESGRLVEELID